MNCASQARHWKDVAAGELQWRLDTVLDAAAIEKRRTRTGGVVPCIGFATPAKPTAKDRDQARRLCGGELSVFHAFPWRPSRIPPAWTENPFGTAAYDFYLHSQQWLRPLIIVGAGDNIARCRRLAREVLRAWILGNASSGGASPGAWGDHAVSYRLRLLCWCWETFRSNGSLAPRFSDLVLAAIYLHACYACDPAQYSADSNHGLHMIGRHA